MIRSDLPEDVTTLQTMVLQLLGQVDTLEQQLACLRRRIFGPRSEKLDPSQLTLFAELAEQLQKLQGQRAALAPATSTEAAASAGAKRNGHGRRPLPADLPRQRTELNPPEEQRTCPSCRVPLKRIGEEVTEELDWVPGSFVVREYARGKYACPACQEHVVIADLPSRPIEKGRPGTGLLAHVITSKYADHTPLHRLEGIFARHGIDLARSTLCNWVRDAADLLSPIYRELKRQVLASHKVHTDDSPVPVLDRTRDRTRTGYLWVYVGDRSNAVFDYTPTHSRDGPLQFLAGYRGYLQADAYKGYDEVFRRAPLAADGQPLLIEVGCWAHGRRKFVDALTSDVRRANEMLALVSQLYAVERAAPNPLQVADALATQRALALDDPTVQAARTAAAEQRRQIRQQRCPVILAEIQRRLEAWSVEVLPKSPLGQAVAYARGQWTALTRYVDDGLLEPDNNRAERALRCVAVGRANWTFAGSDAGGQRAAIHYSLVASCKLCGVDPFAYLRDVLQRVSTHRQSRIAELTPAAWKLARLRAAESAANATPSAAS